MGKFVLPCNWRGCNFTTVDKGRLKEHWRECLGQDLPPLNTGFTCKLPDCRCGGVDFPNKDRLNHHQDETRGRKCTGPICGCGGVFKLLSKHLAYVQSAKAQDNATQRRRKWREREKRALRDQTKEQRAEDDQGKIQREAATGRMDGELDDDEDDVVVVPPPKRQKMVVDLTVDDDEEVEYAIEEYDDLREKSHGNALQVC